MNPYEFILAIIALVLVFKLVRTVMLHKSANLSGRDDTLNAELVERLHQVEERVRVLERIVTDERTDLKQQFRDLESQ
jgi:hypothetical protein